MGPTGACARVLQIHVTRRCNLRCLHCYSSSGPEEVEQLPSTLLRSALDDASAEGYTVVGVSGGEPLLYRPLAEVLDHAGSLGLVRTVTTNGMLLDERRLARLQGRVDLLAVSLDGMPASHNRMRGSPRAFETMLARLEGLRQTGIPFGFIFTLTRWNLHEAEWVAQFALEQGARLLQLHPLEVVGRASAELPGSEPDGVEAAYAFLEAARLQEMAGDRLYVQLDLTDRELLRDNPERGFADDVAAGDRPLSELISPLVVEPDGWVVPVQHGFARAYALGSLHEAPLRELGARWRRDHHAHFRALCRQVYEEATVPAPLPFFNWYEAVGRAAAGAVV